VSPHFDATGGFMMTSPRTWFRPLAVLMPLALMLALAAGVSAADEEFVTNGTFDTNLAGWTVPVSGGCSNTIWVSDGNPGGSAWLNACGEVANDPSIEQALTGLVIGETYRLTGEYRSVASSFGNPAKQDAFEVELDASVILSLGRPSPVATAWTAFMVDFEATATSHTIAFYAERDGDDSDFAIDNISVMGQADATPTPSPSPSPTTSPSPTPSPTPDGGGTLPPTDTVGGAPTSAAGSLDWIGGLLVVLLAMTAIVALHGRSFGRATR
jgi:hypothetical protein